MKGTKFLQKIKFSSLYEMSSGISSNKSQAGHGAPFLSFSNVFNNYFLPDTLEERMDTNSKEQETYSIKKGDIFLTRTSETLTELAMSSVSLKDYPNATFSGFLKRLRPKQKNSTDSKFMGYYLRSNFFRKTITNNAIMTLRASFNEEIFSYLDLYLPEINNQKKIGEILYSLDAKIALNNKINRELEAMAKTIYDYWFVQFEFPNEKGKPYRSSGGKMVWNDELKREIPEGWKVVELGEIAEIKAGGDKPKEFSLVKNEYFNVPIYANGIINDGLYGYSTKAKINKRSITISARGTIGHSVIRNKPFIPIIRLIVVTPFSSSHTDYIFQFIQMNEFGKSGSVQQQLTSPMVSSVKILNPDTLLSKSFDSILSKISNNIELYKGENQSLTQFRDFLLPLLMNGQVTVGK